VQVFELLQLMQLLGQFEQVSVLGLK